MYLGSLASAIFLFASITEIPHSRSRVLPVINTSSIATIAAELENGEIIIGQSEISHPSSTSSSSGSSSNSPSGLPTPSTLTPISSTPISGLQPNLRKFKPSNLHISSPLHATFTPLSLTRPSTPSISLFQGPILGDEEPTSQQRRRSSSAANTTNSYFPGTGGSAGEEGEEVINDRVIFDKNDTSKKLPSRISRIFYLNAYGQETLPRCNPLFLEELNRSTSYVPFLPSSFLLCLLTSLVIQID